LFFGEGVAFMVATLNMRACAKGWIPSTLLTDALIAGLNFYMIHRIAEAGTWQEQAAYTAGAVCGSATGMALTRRWTDAEVINATAPVGTPR
jgi:uncharacterized membrane protein YfcA